MKDGIFWGLGHASTIFVIGILMLLFKVGISAQYFRYFEATAGGMLIALALYRLTKFFRGRIAVLHTHPHVYGGDNDTHLHVTTRRQNAHQRMHSLAFVVGLLHGLAGSGALILLAMSAIKGPVEGLAYLVLFGTGCIGGMLLAAGLLSIPFSKKIMQARTLHGILIITSSTLCLAYGSKVIYENLIV